MMPLEALEKISGVRVLVVGDLMLDRYWWGSSTRISPEAPVPVVGLSRETVVLGGAANVAANVIGLGATATLCGVFGDDGPGSELLSGLESAGIANDLLLKVSGRPTTVKTRILANNQQVARVDSEVTSPLNESDQQALIRRLETAIPEADVVLISDYAKGILSDTVLRSLIDFAKAAGKKVLVDPKGKDFSRYAGADVLTPNNKETIEAFDLNHIDEAMLVEAVTAGMKRLNVGAVLVTRGEHGMLLVREGSPTFSLEASAREVFDVTGAGDTVIATLACGIAAGIDFEDAVRLANLAAGIVIQHTGTTAIRREMFTS